MNFKAYVIANMLAELEEMSDQHSITAQSLRLALSGLGVETLPSQVTKLIQQGKDSVLKAFWECYIHTIELPVAETRLLVNPPAGLKVAAANVLTLRTQSVLDGRYGAEATEAGHIRLYRANIPNTYFEDLVIFWGKGTNGPTDSRLLAESIAPGSTVTLIRSSEEHRSWMSYYGIEHDSDLIMEEIIERFRMASLWCNNDPNVVIEIIGVESPK